ncbi:curli production assembly/transport component CsgG [candidate division KSB1 bacterium]|nr:curli production assembly/transport component CsgG [candidate division KSB1 bacterium]
MRYLKILMLLIIVTYFGGCAFNMKMFPTEQAQLGEPTEINSYLRSLPVPKEKIVIAVYKFRDQTGQYKASSTGVTWSTAVTQGATSMLLKALEDSDWFISLEREGLSNLLNERKIIRSTRENYSGSNVNNLPTLPPLLYAGITLEGGIISYETNVITGGFGAKYFGVGGSAQYRRDEVTIYLRAVSTQTGRILKTVYTTKSILSQLVDVGLYKYVKFKRLLEVETGYSSNEPPQLCVLEAIEKAVYGLIIEGIVDKLWELKNPDDVNSPIIKAYLKEKQEAEQLVQINEKGNIASKSEFYDAVNMVRKKWGLGGNITAQTYAGDYPHPQIKLAGEFHIKYGLSSCFSAMLSGGAGHIADRDYFIAKNVHLDLKGIFMPFPKKQFSPYLTLGASALNFWTSTKNGTKIYRQRQYGGWKPALVSGIGVEYFISPTLGFNIGVENYFSLTDELDGMIHGKKDDYPWSGRFGFTYYLKK